MHQTLVEISDTQRDHSENHSQLLLREAFRNRGVSKPGCFPLFSGKVQIVSRTLSGLFLVGALDRPRKRKRTNRENPRTIPEQIGKIPEKSEKSPKRTKKDKRKEKGEKWRKKKGKKWGKKGGKKGKKGRKKGEKKDKKGQKRTKKDKKVQIGKPPPFETPPFSGP